MVSPYNPISYTGPKYFQVPAVTRNREPTSADVVQPETGKNYCITTIWQVGKSPTTGTEGEMFILTKIVANVAYWELFTSAAFGTVNTLTGNTGDPAGPDDDGNIDILGDGTVLTFDSDSLTNTVTGSIQLANDYASSSPSQAGVCSFYNEQFAVDANGFVKLAGGNTIAADEFLIDGSSAPGTNPVVPQPVGGANPGRVTITGDRVSTNQFAEGVRVFSDAANSYKVQIQEAGMNAGSAGANKFGMCQFDQNQFTVTNGFVQLSGGSDVFWQTITASQTLAVSNGYICISPGGALSLALPASSAVGDEIEVTLDGATSWTITQGAGQQIRYGNVQTTSGVGGSLASTAAGNSIRMVCSVANLKWNVISALGTLVVT